jgi:hypothetical protein
MGFSSGRLHAVLGTANWRQKGRADGLGKAEIMRTDRALIPFAGDDHVERVIWTPLDRR